MTDEKYYEPELNDYHLGMECQIMTKAGWGTGCFPDVFLLNSELDQYKEDYNKAAHAVVRVKRLDHDDIVAAGWEYDGKMYKLGKYTLTNIVLHELICIDNTNIGTIFKGTIRNASELSVLMRQLGITK